jgi:integrase
VALRWPVAYRLHLRGRIRSRDHRYSLDEAAALWIAAGQMGRRGALVRFLLLTACRRIEAQHVERSHLILDDPVIGPHWQQPAHLTKTDQPHRVPLAPAAVALLRWLPQRHSRQAGPAALVFAGEGNRPIGGWTDIRRRLLELAGVEDGTLHDIRRTVVSTLGDHGFDPQVVDTLLNHAAATTMGGVMGVYQRSDFWAQRRRAIETWAELLMEKVAAKLRTPLCRDTWGFTAPFEEVRIRRPSPGDARLGLRSTGLGAIER